MEAGKLNFNELSRYVYQKFGLKFKPAIPGSTELYVLESPLDGAYFAMMSRIKKTNAGMDQDGYISTLDLRCGSFSDMIRDLPGFSAAFRLKANDWVGVWLDQASEKTVKQALDYAFKLAMNKNEQVDVSNSQYIFVPGEKVDNNYQSQAIKPRSKVRRKNNSNVPNQILKMQEAYDYSLLPSMGREKNFYHQAVIMKDYEDDFDEKVNFKQYYPTYHDMKISQLRTYFTWRKNIRKGKFEKISTSYAYVYVYELLNDVADDPKKSFRKLREFINKYILIYDVGMLVNVESWLKDYVIYYQLDHEAVEAAFKQELSEDHNYQVLLKPEEYSAKEIFAVLEGMSTYLKNCLSYKKLGEQFEEIVYYVWKSLVALKLEPRRSFFSKYVATASTLSKKLFAGAVFYQRKSKFEDFDLDPVRHISYQDGHCYLKAYYPIKNQKSEINTFLHEIDRLLRKEFSLGRPLKARPMEKHFLEVIETGIKNYESEKEQEKRKVEIDFSSLNKIRSDASVTRDSLLTEDELRFDEEDLKENVQDKQDKIESKDTEEGESYGLDPDELYLVKALLKGLEYKDYVKSHHLMLSIVVDNINEKLFDEIGDSVVEFDEKNQPIIVEDYLDDLNEMFK